MKNDAVHGTINSYQARQNPDSVPVSYTHLDKESPEECLVREVREETGLTLTDYAYRGLVTFVSDRWETEYMHLFTGHTQQDLSLIHICSGGPGHGGQELPHRGRDGSGRGH